MTIQSTLVEEREGRKLGKEGLGVRDGIALALTEVTEAGKGGKANRKSGSEDQVRYLSFTLGNGFY